MSDIRRRYSETAGGANAPSPNGAPEGMAPSASTTPSARYGRDQATGIGRTDVTSGGPQMPRSLTCGAARPYIQGQRFCFIAGFSNTPVTLNVNGIGAKAISAALR